MRTNVACSSGAIACPPKRPRARSTISTARLGELTSLFNELVELATDESRRRAAAGMCRSNASPSERVRASSAAYRTNGADRWRRWHHHRPTRRVDRAVRNLLDNAAKFDPTGYPIEVTIRGGHLEVRDRGPGISPTDVAHIFDRFYRSDAARNQPGSGLGLAIVADIAVAHGGRAFAFNHPQGGAVVGFDLGVDREGPNASPAASDHGGGD